MFKKTILAGFAFTALLSVQAQATTVNINANGQWNAFDVDELTSASGGTEWIDLNDGSALSFSLTLAAPSYLTVVDGGFAGDKFHVYDNGNLLGETGPVTNTYPTSLGLNFDAALTNSNYSQAVFYLAAGNHLLTGNLSASALDDTNSALNSTVGGLKVSAVPLPFSALLLFSGTSVLGFFTRRRAA